MVGFENLAVILLPDIVGCDPLPRAEIVGHIKRVIPSGFIGDDPIIRSKFDEQVFMLILLIVNDTRVENQYISLLTDIITPSEMRLRECVNKIQFVRMVYNMKSHYLPILYRSIYADQIFDDYRLRVIQCHYIRTRNERDNMAFTDAHDILNCGLFYYSSLFDRIYNKVLSWLF